MSDAILPDAIPAKRSPESTPPPSLGLKKLSGNIGYMLFTQVTATALSLATTIAFTRGLGPAGNAVQGLAWIVPTLSATLFSLGISPANSYFLGAKKVQPKAAIHATFVLSCFLALIAIVVAVPVIYFLGSTLFRGVDKVYLWWMVALSPITLMQMSLASVFLGVQNFKPYNVSAILIPFTTFGTALLLVTLMHLGVTGALAAYSAGQIVSLAITVYYLLPYLAVQEEPVPIAKYAIECISYGYKAHLSNIVGFINYRIDTILLNMIIIGQVGKEKGQIQVGIYFLAVRIAEMLWIIAQAASQVAMPRLAELNSDPEAQSQLTPIVCRWVLIATLAGSLAYIVIGPFAIPLFFGAKFTGAYPLLLWLLPGVILLSVSKVLSNDIFARGLVLLNFYLGLAMLLINIVVNLAFIPIWGATGAAIASSIGYLADTAVRLIIYARLSGNHWWAPLVPRQHDWELLRKGRKLVQSRLTARR